MKILHTSDWHLGRRLKNKDRSDEFMKFFAWLNDLITREKIDVLLVAGDIFDNTTPSVQAQEMYYSFLNDLANSPCRHCIIISGNHDSPSFLDAHSKLLKRLNIHVIGNASQNPDDEVIMLKNPDLIVCAVPYLHDRDVRKSNIDDDINTIEQALKTGIREHYNKVLSRAKDLNASNMPIIAMGHLFVQGGRVNQDDGTRSLYVGTAIEIKSDIFPDDLAYTALGHLHSPQFVGRENIRYSGAPIAMGFGEVGTQKAVCIIELDEDNNASIKDVPVPEFQKLERVSGDLDEILDSIRNLSHENESIWLDVTYTGNDIIGDLNERLNDFVKKWPLLEILAVHNESRQSQDTSGTQVLTEGLESISPVDMLVKRFEADKTPQSQREIFIKLYQEILHEMELDY